jgi:hypothetical protein
MTWNSRDDSGLYRIPERLPTANSGDWVVLCHRMMHRFTSEHGDVRPAVKARRLLIIHPGQASLVDEARAIYNGDSYPGSDGDGNVVALPRVWRWEHYFHVFFVIELPDGLNARSMLLWNGDRELVTG